MGAERPLCVKINPFSASSPGMQQLLAPAGLLTLAPNVQSPSLNAHNYFISEPVLLQFFYRVRSNGSSCQFQCRCTSFITSSYRIVPRPGDVNETSVGSLAGTVL